MKRNFVSPFKFRISVFKWWLDCSIWMATTARKSILHSFFVDVVRELSIVELDRISELVPRQSRFHDCVERRGGSGEGGGGKSVMSTDVIAPSPSLFSTRKTDRSLFQYESKTDCGYQRQEPEWNYHNKGLRPGRDDGIWTTASARIRKVNELSYQTQKIAYRSLVPPFDFPTDTSDRDKTIQLLVPLTFILCGRNKKNRTENILYLSLRSACFFLLLYIYLSPVLLL